MFYDFPDKYLLKGKIPCVIQVRRSSPRLPHKQVYEPVDGLVHKPESGYTMSVMTPNEFDVRAKWTLIGLTNLQFMLT